MTTAYDDHARTAYEELGPGYDDLTAGHDHAGWTALLLDRARRAGQRGTRLLDVACGTGNTLVPMLERGFSATGLDISEAMLAEAERKTDGRARLVAGDMRALPRLGAFDLIWCLGDAVNYLDDADELVATFRGFERNLADGGVVVLDVDTLATMRSLSSSLLVVPNEDRVVVLEGHLDPDGRLITWIDRLDRLQSGWWTRTRSEHRQRHHAEPAIRAALAAAGLHAVAVYGTDGAGALEAPLEDLRHSKAVFIARREAL